MLLDVHCLFALLDTFPGGESYNRLVLVIDKFGEGAYNLLVVIDVLVLLYGLKTGFLPGGGL